MTASGLEARVPADPSIPGSAGLAADLGEAATREFLAENGWTVVESRPVQLMYRPGRRMTVRRAAAVERDGYVRRMSVVTEVRRRPRSIPAVRPTEDLPVPVRSDSGLTTWAFPHDPHLPDLASALTIDGAREIAESVTGWPASVRSSVVRYRPGTRAVLRYEVRPRGQGRADPILMFVKVMRAQAADHVIAVTSDPPERPHISPPASRPAPGVLVFRAVEGADLREVLLGDQPAPAAPRFAGLVEQFRDWPDPGAPQASDPLRRLEAGTAPLRVVLPGLGDRITRLQDAIAGRIRPTEQAVVHGDMHEGQVMVGPSGSLIVLDVDDIGVGEPAMDAANALAHLTSLGESHPDAAPRLAAYRDQVREAYLAQSSWDPSDLDAREAVALAQLAGGPMRVLSANWPDRVDARLRLAERAAGLV